LNIVEQSQRLCDILRLQSANYMANLSKRNAKTGFLSAQFTPEQTAQIAEDLGTIGPAIDDQIVGFVCAFRNNSKLGRRHCGDAGSYDRMIFEGRR